ncbi:hypothetical protein J5N97_001804 [Dioscorea zingiberensis]|uniref:Protein TRIGALACTOSYLDIACYLGLYCEROL 4, chloroplastic n=1 Tax=Dioscorea zingiberensis TaxID=325984 RepID=A0A9D5BT79_9LILI|nr:hypothetical protein J5N97_001804 [Dioscorea zingiberensis]
MANLRAVMDSEFWDLNQSSPQALDGTARSVPGDPAPLALARSPRTVRPQQLSFLSQAFPLGLIPSFSPGSQKELGSFAIQSFLPGPSSSSWWTGLAWQFRPMKLISGIKKEFTVTDELELPAFKDIAKHVVDKSLYALGLFSQISPTPDTSLLLNLEKHGDRDGRRSKAVFIHRLPNHDITMEAASPDLFLDSKGAYWDVPNTLSLDVASLVSDSGFRYRFGLHRNGGSAEARKRSLSINTPLALMPGTWAKAAFSFEKSKDLWRVREKKASRSREEPTQLPPYDIRLKEPHSSVSGIIGAACAAWFGGKKNLNATSETQSFSADLFGSISYTLQHGKFRNDFNDLTRIDARLDVRSAKAFINEAGHLVYGIFKDPINREVDPLASPQLNLIFQQQVAGPVIFRAESRVSINSGHGKLKPHVEDVLYGLSYSFRMLQSGKILAWYSPNRKEAMVELRVFEF